MCVRVVTSRIRIDSWIDFVQFLSAVEVCWHCREYFEGCVLEGRSEWCCIIELSQGVSIPKDTNRLCRLQSGYGGVQQEGGDCSTEMAYAVANSLNLLLASPNDHFTRRHAFGKFLSIFQLR
jgi:hypothetical protein